jgi:hypothetical protein
MSEVIGNRALENAAIESVIAPATATAEPAGYDEGFLGLRLPAPASAVPVIRLPYQHLTSDRTGAPATPN